MRLVDPSPDFVAHVALRMRARDYQEFSATSWAQNRAELAEALATTYGGRADVWAACSDEGLPVAVGGALQTRPGVITLLFFATDAFTEVLGPVTRLFKARLLPAVEAAGAHRIECMTLATNTDAHRWLEALGLSQEAELQQFGRDRQRFLIYARLTDDHPTGS